MTPREWALAFRRTSDLTIDVGLLESKFHQAIAEEREACAQLAEQHWNGIIGGEIAERIRARGA